jgi:hypothetical protein
VRYRLMATYRGSPFEAGIGPTDGDIVLFAACPPPEELGFEPATGHWRRQLRIADVQAVWESRPIGTFRGERCMVLDDLGDRLHIGYLGHDGFRAEQLGYWQVDRGVFELVAPRTEVTDILEERTEYRRPVPAPQPTAATGQATGSHPGSGPHPSPGPLTGPLTGPLPAVTTVAASLADPAAPPRSGRSTYPSPESRASAEYATPAAAPQPTSYGSVHDEAAPVTFQPTSELPAALQPDTESGQHRTRTAISHGLSAGATSSQPPAAYLPSAPDLPVPDDSTGVALPIAAPAPLPLEAEAMRAASAARRPRPMAERDDPANPPVPAAPAEPADAASGTHRQPVAPSAAVPAASPSPAAMSLAAPAAVMSAAAPPVASALAPASLAAANPPAPTDRAATAPATPAPEPAVTPSRPRRAARRRMATERLFADLAGLAGIPADSYAVGEDVEGALCLVQTQQGFEVFHSANGARHELQVFTTEESACFYLFGVLAAEAVRNGSLARAPASLGTGQG